jgi:hypothetical protein
MGHMSRWGWSQSRVTPASAEHHDSTATPSSHCYVSLPTCIIIIIIGSSSSTFCYLPFIIRLVAAVVVVVVVVAGLVVVVAVVDAAAVVAQVVVAVVVELLGVAGVGAEAAEEAGAGTPAMVALFLQSPLVACVASGLGTFAGMSWQPTEHPWGQQVVEEAGWRAGAG